MLLEVGGSAELDSRRWRRGEQLSANTMVGSVAPRRVTMPLVLTALAVGVAFQAAPAHAQITYCFDQGVILEKSIDWCRQRGRTTAAVTIAVPGRPTDLEAMKLLQLQLLSLGFDPGTLDGHMGPSTATALRAFQRARGLPVDGIANESVRAKLQAETAQLRQDWEKRNDAQKPGQESAGQPAPPAAPAPAPSAHAAPAVAETAASKGTSTGGDTLSGGDALRLFLFNPLTILAALVAAYFLRPTALLRRRVRRQLARTTGLADIPPILAGLTERQLAACLKQRLAYFRHHVDSRIVGDVLDDAGITALNDVQAALRLSDIDIGHELPRIRNAHARYSLRQGRLPELTGTALIERPGEKTHFVTSATLHEERKSEGATMQQRGWTFALPLGIGHNRNTFDTRSVTNRQQEPVGLGMLYITSQRLVFTGDLEALSIDYAYILAAHPVADGVSISLHEGNARLIRFADKASIPLGHEILNRVAP